MIKLDAIINQLEAHIKDFEKINLDVTKSTVGWQINHSFLVINQVIPQIKKSDPYSYKWKFNKNRFIVQTILRKIPRGKVRAPKEVQPFEEISEDHLKTQLENTRKNILELKSLGAKNYFVHPFMGDLNLKKTIYFLELHTKHHLKIIEDMLA